MQACADLPDGHPMKVYGGIVLTYTALNDRATECGLAASTVTLTPPALDTCEGAAVRYNAIEG